MYIFFVFVFCVVECLKNSCALIRAAVVVGFRGSERKSTTGNKRKRDNARACKMPRWTELSENAILESRIQLYNISPRRHKMCHTKIGAKVQRSVKIW